MIKHRLGVAAFVVGVSSAPDEPFWPTILAVTRKEDANAFCLPGGKVDTPQEHPIDACIRELYEETGLKADPSQMELVFGSSEYGSRKWTCLTYRVYALLPGSRLGTDEPITPAFVSPTTIYQGPFKEYYERLYNVIGFPKIEDAVKWL
jgi:8-oxo-dGTP pyrophosphatase MutT (NUDIX family)